LNDQTRPDEIRSSFVSPQYASGVSQAIERFGLKEVFKSVKAKVWANQIDNASVVRAAHDTAKSAYETAYQAKAAELSNNLLETMAIVSAGMDKNFFAETGNPLKEAFWMAIKKAGISNPMPIIESAFSEGSTPYFQTILDKSVEYLNMSPEALAEIKKAITQSDVIKPEEPKEAEAEGEEIPEGEEEETLASHLANNQVNAFALATASHKGVDQKSKLRNELKLSMKKF